MIDCSDVLGITNLRLGKASKVNLHVVRIRRDHRSILFICSGENSVIVKGDLLNISYSFGLLLLCVEQNIKVRDDDL